MAILIAAMMTDRRPMSRSFSRENSMPTRKRRRIAPSSIAAFISSTSVRRPSALGPTSAPAMRTPRTDGCLSRVAKTPPRTENVTITMRFRARSMGISVRVLFI